MCCPHGPVKTQVEDAPSFSSPFPQGDLLWLLHAELSDRPQDVGCCRNCSGPEGRRRKVWAACRLTVQGEPPRGAEEVGGGEWTTPGGPAPSLWQQEAASLQSWLQPQLIRWPCLPLGPLWASRSFCQGRVSMCMGRPLGSPPSRFSWGIF